MFSQNRNSTTLYKKTEIFLYLPKKENSKNSFLYLSEQSDAYSC